LAWRWPRNGSQVLRIDLAALNNHHEPESPEAALLTYSKLVMPERNVDATVKQLTPMLNDPNLIKKISDAADKNRAALARYDWRSGYDDGATQQVNNRGMVKKFWQENGYQAMQNAQGNNYHAGAGGWCYCWFARVSKKIIPY
jgi:hypothetical protein